MTEPHVEILRSIPVGWCLLVVSQRALCSPYQDAVQSVGSKEISVGLYEPLLG